jgi:hypothetical protein
MIKADALAGVWLLMVAEPVAAGAQGLPTVPTEVLFVNRGLTDPAGPLELSVTVHLFSGQRLLEILARAGRHPSYPAALFHDRDVLLRFQLPPGVVLEEGSLTWSGELRGDEVAEALIRVRVPDDLDAYIEASVIGHGVGGRVDADVERFYIVARGPMIKLSRDPVTQRGGRSPPGASTH